MAITRLHPPPEPKLMVEPDDYDYINVRVARPGAREGVGPGKEK